MKRRRERNPQDAMNSADGGSLRWEWFDRGLAMKNGKPGRQGGSKLRRRKREDAIYSRVERGLELNFEIILRRDPRFKASRFLKLRRGRQQKSKKVLGVERSLRNLAKRAVAGFFRDRIAGNPAIVSPN